VPLKILLFAPESVAHPKAPRNVAATPEPPKALLLPPPTTIELENTLLLFDPMIHPLPPDDEMLFDAPEIIALFAAPMKFEVNPPIITELAGSTLESLSWQFVPPIITAFVPLFLWSDPPTTTPLALVAQLLLPANNPLEAPDATLSEAERDNCKSTAPAPRLFPPVAVPSGNCPMIAPVPFG
jgi:hypothetical protein